MAWDKGRYYTRSTKVNGRVVREYVGSGRVANWPRNWTRSIVNGKSSNGRAEKFERDRLECLDEKMDELDAMVDRVARAALQAAGFHQHKRGEWRKRRGRNPKV